MREMKDSMEANAGRINLLYMEYDCCKENYDAFRRFYDSEMSDSQDELFQKAMLWGVRAYKKDVEEIIDNLMHFDENELLQKAKCLLNDYKKLLKIANAKYLQIKQSTQNSAVQPNVCNGG